MLKRKLIQNFHFSKFYSSKCIGIDLGTTNSCVAILDGQTPKVIENIEGFRTTPSIVSFDKQGNKTVGITAKRQAVTNPENTIYAVKRLIGKQFKDLKEKSSYKVIPSADGACYIQLLNKKTYSPEEISSFILTKMKETAENYLKVPIKDAVITVPAYFNDSQRKATQDAGLNVKRIINEPTAAALAYGLDKNKNGIFAVYDLGGGTFDISILEINGGVFQVKATNGDTNLGGEDFDNKVYEWIIKEFEKKEGVKVEGAISLQRIKDSSEKAKIELTSATKTQINLPFLQTSDGYKNLELELDRDTFYSLVDDLIQRTLEPCKKCVRDAKIEMKNITEVILVGGMTRDPKIVQSVQNFFGKIPSKGVNPDEAVAVGAAIQGGVLTGNVDDVVLIDVTPLSLGTSNHLGVFVNIIPRNTQIPTKRSKMFTTVKDNQSAVQFDVYQGEREMAANNKLLGQFTLQVPPVPKGIPQLEVTFTIDANGILNCSAIDKGTGNKGHITIQSSSNLTDRDIDRMVRDAEKFAEQDKKKKELVEKINESESVINIAKESMAKLDLTPQEIGDIEASFEKLRSAISREDFNEINEQFENVKKLQGDLSTKAYKQSSNTSEEK